MSVKGIIMFLGMNNTRLERKILITLDFENGFLPTYLPQCVGSSPARPNFENFIFCFSSLWWFIIVHIAFRMYALLTRLDRYLVWNFQRPFYLKRPRLKNILGLYFAYLGAHRSLQYTQFLGAIFFNTFWISTNHSFLFPMWIPKRRGAYRDRHEYK